MALADRAELAVRLTLDDKAFSGPLRRAQGSLGRFGQSAGRVGKGVGQIGAGLARAGLLVGGAAITGIAAVARAAIDFEDAFAGVRKTVNEADLTAVGMSFESLALEFRKMATEIPIAATEFARLGETAGALGVKAQDIDDFVKTTALLGVTTDLTADAAATALGKVGTILGLTGSQYQDFADVLVNLGNQGASTESEIIEVAKRFAGTGRQAGLTTEQILALSSAITSLGAEPEAAGSALSRIFSNVATEIANGTKKGKEFSEITGDSMDELRKRINKGDALGIVMDSLEAISGMSRTEAASTLRALGITNVRDRDAILKMSQNLGFVNDQLKIAGDSTGALGREAEKRFSTIASKLTLVKQNAIEAALTMGSEFLPAIGRVADRAIALLKDPATKAELAQLGKDIGKTIDGIDWTKVAAGAKSFAGAMKGALDFVLVLAAAIDKLPGELKAAGLGFLALNKLSGGLIGAGAGNVVGGLAGAAARGVGSKVPGLGKLFAQPVFVTNWPMGGIGAAGGVAGKGGGLLGKVGGILGVTALAGMASEFSDELTGFGIDLRKQIVGENFPTISAGQLEWPFGPKNTPSILPEIFGGNGLLGGTTRGAGTGPGAPVTAVRDNQHLDAQRAAAAALERLRIGAEANRIAVVTKIGALGSIALSTSAAQRATLERVRVSNEANRISTVTGLSGTRAAINNARINTNAVNRSGDASIVAAIRGIQRPIISVSVTGNVIRTTYQTGATLTRSIRPGILALT